MIRRLLPAAFACILATSLLAQCDVGGGAVDLRINGILPLTANATTHDVEVGAAPWTLAISGGVNAPFILVGGVGIACGQVPTPWGGSIDLSGAAVILNGLQPLTAFDYFAVTDFQFALPPLAGVCGQGFGPPLQAIFADGTNPPFFLRNTQAGRPVSSGKTTVYDAVGDDVFVTHALTCGIVYGGAIYNQLFIGSNGMVTFASGSTDFTPTAAEFFNGFRATNATGSNPGVAVMQGDYARATATTDNITVTETYGIGTVQVAYNNQQHWTSQTSAGSFSVTFGASGPDSLQFNIAGFTAGAATDTGIIVGVSDGTNAAGGLDTNGDLTALVLAGGGFYASPSAPESIMELFAAGAAPDFQIMNFIHMGGFAWTMF